MNSTIIFIIGVVRYPFYTENRTQRLLILSLFTALSFLMHSSNVFPCDRYRLNVGER